MLNNIQALRALAALLVVHGHASGPAGLGLDWHSGANGVDLFFVISGFIIAYVASSGADRFMTRRVIRIVPIYWSTTLVLYALVLIAPHLFRTTSNDPKLLLLSLAFLPAPWSVHTSDGLPHPTLGGGWTLNYEMYFYVVFALALAISKRRPTVVAAALVVGVVGLVLGTGLDRYVVPRFYGDPIVLEFVYGMIAFHIVTLVNARKDAGASIPSKWLLFVGTVGGLAMLVAAESIFGGSARWLASGLPSFFVVVSAVLLERLYGARIENRAVLAIGDASYVLYLIHAYVLYGLLRLVLRQPHFNSQLVGQLVTIALTLACVLAALVAYRVYEQPLLRILKSKFLPRAAGPRASPS